MSGRSCSELAGQGGLSQEARPISARRDPVWGLITGRAGVRSLTDAEGHWAEAGLPPASPAQERPGASCASSSSCAGQQASGEAPKEQEPRAQV